MSAFRLAIVREDGEPVKLKPGAEGERDFVEAICDQASARGIGLLRTEAQVKRRIAEAVAAVFKAVKGEVEPRT